jgi:hypothetical protein
MGTSTPRRLIATLAALGAAVSMRSWGDHDLPRALWLPTLLLAASAFLVWRRQLGGQLIARAVWWSNLLLGTLIALCSSEKEQSIAALLALCSGTALLAAGRGDLDEEAASSRFVPLAFRGTLMCMLVMAMADAQSLLLFGSIRMTELSAVRANAPMIATALALLIAVIGLYRLRLWALALTLVSNLALTLVALYAPGDLPKPMRVAYVASALAQWLVSLPLLFALARRRAPVARRSIERTAQLGAALLIVLMMGTSLACALSHHRVIYW